MREAIGGTWLFSIVIVFIVLFSGYLAVSVNYSKAFKVKNGIVTIIEQNDGINSNTISEIDSYLSSVGYYVYGECKADSEGSRVIKGDYEVTNSNRYRYCIVEREGDSYPIQKYYYKVTVYFRLDLPVIGDIFTFPVSGETKAVYSKVSV